MIAPLSFPKFLSGWLPALAVSATLRPSPRLADAFVVPIGGVAFPLLTCALGALGVLLARPLARRAEEALPLRLFLVVSTIMLVTVQIWIIDTRPNALFAFVVAIGLGFSGYSLIEMVAAQVRQMISRVTGDLTSQSGKPDGNVAPLNPKDPNS